MLIVSAGMAMTGRSLMRLPGGGEWAIDAVSTSGGRWQRWRAPRFTVRPSILSVYGMSCHA